MKRTWAAKQLLEHEYKGEGSSEYSGTEFGGFGQYIANKVRKLRNQATADQTIQSDIFRGCIIYVTGYTNPPLNELKRLITIHGGVHSQFFEGKTTITHVIATGLSTSKRVELANFPVVKPEWITESIHASRILPWTKYATYPAKATAFTRAVNEIDDSKRSGEDVTPVSEEEPVHGEIEEPAAVDGLADDSATTSAAPRVNCLDPNFITNYYKNSRLHHLSIWKAELKRRFQKLAQKNNDGHRKSRSRDESAIDDSGAAHERIILHVDFDSFFVAIALKKRPDLADKPVCVSSGGTKNADIASCNYVARKYGVHNGMWVSSALELCPNLQCLGYDFDAYESASTALYESIIEMHPDIIFPVSVDEALIDVTSICSPDGPTVVTDGESGSAAPNSIQREVSKPGVLQLARQLRGRIREKTGIEASVGAGPNVVLAKLALRRAKPAGEFYVRQAEAKQFVHQVKIGDLPGIGPSASGKILEGLGVSNLNELSELTTPEQQQLEKLVGPKMAKRLLDYSEAKDDTDISVIEGPKSIGVEIAWGVRVKSESEALQFLTNLAKELCSRLRRILDDDLDEGKGPRHMTLKIYRRAPNAPIEPEKFMGCGECIAYSKSRMLDTPISGVDDMMPTLKELYLGFECPALDLRGVGIQFKLEGQSDISSDEALKARNAKVTGHFVPISREQMIEQAQRMSPKPLKTPQQSPTKKATTLSPFRAGSPSKRASPSKRRQLGNDHQQAHIVSMFQGKIEEEILRELPTQIRNEVIEERRNLFGTRRLGTKKRKVVVGHNGMAVPEAGPNVKADAVRDDDQMRKYTPSTFCDTSNMEDIRDIVKKWVDSSLFQHGPHYDDICKFEAYLVSAITNDQDWAKAIRLLDWMRALARSRGDPDWIYLTDNFRHVAADQLLTKRGIRIDSLFK